MDTEMQDVLAIAADRVREAVREAKASGVSWTDDEIEAALVDAAKDRTAWGLQLTF